MKKIFAQAVLCYGFFFTADAQVRMPAPSPAQTIKQEFALGTIEVNYSRPAVKNRKIFGDLVPYGKIWRTGANEATRIRFSDPVELNGKKIDSGSYVIYTIPGIDFWEIIFNKGLDNWGTDGYKESQDVLRIKVEPRRAKIRTESFTIQFVNVLPQSAELQILWDKILVPVPISTNVKDRLKQQIETALKQEKKPHWQAAQYYYEYEQNLPKAIEHCTKAIEANPKAYWIMLFKARILLENGDKQAAREMAQKSKELAKEDGNDDYVKMNEDLLRKIK